MTTRIALLGGAYEARSVIASAQRCVNLFQEPNPQNTEEPAPLTHYPTAGLRLLLNIAGNGTRCTYRASNGALYVVVQNTVYFISTGFVATTLGTISNRATPCYMSDNGLAIVVVDGSASGWAIDMASNQFAQITDPTFSGSYRCDYVDTYLLFTRPNTNIFYISLSECTFQMLTGTPGAILTGSIIDAGTLYVDGTYNGVSLTGGTGTGAIANIIISGGTVTSVAIADAGNNYLTGDVLGIDAANIGITGVIATGTIANAGSGYVNGTYAGINLNGGTGTGAMANITVAGGVITVVALTQGGTGYLVGDALSVSAADIGGTGSGFLYTVTILTNPGTGFAYSINTISGYAFDPLDFAAKTGYPDTLLGVIVMHREIWLIGNLTSEVWNNTGASDFTFAPIPGAFIDHGTISPYSIAVQDLHTYLLSRDKQGHLIVVDGSFYEVKRISTYAIENEFAGYSTTNDAIGFTYQQEGHTYYAVVFPTANAGWAYDISTQLWHQWAWTDNNGNLNRPRAAHMCFAYAENIVGDWENGNIYALDLDATTDNGQPISRIRSFPHAMNNGNRQVISRIVADMQCGTDDGTIDGSTPANPPMVNLRISRNRGQSYGNYMQRSMGAAGQYNVFPQWRNQGMARDTVIEFSWSTPALTALNGAFVEVEESET